MSRPWAHPRAGGENSGKARGSTGRRGSSPRGRGKHYGADRRCARSRLIPARAGKTAGPAGRNALLPAHPRAGGENREGCHASPRASGSSPRGRGKRPQGLGGDHRRGLIPARAGKTTLRTGQSTAIWAHPRAGGENCLASVLSCNVAGSSPRGRGKRFGAHQTLASVRLIPARAGKT